MSKHDRGPADAWNDGRHVKPTNVSRSYHRGGGTMRHVEERHEEAKPHHPSGGSGTQPKLYEDGDGSDLGY